MEEALECWGYRAKQVVQVKTVVGRLPFVEADVLIGFAPGLAIREIERGVTSGELRDPTASAFVTCDT
ncbi:hypothetical protein, partial [Klebsiella pneumoniae]|uniref:hypothetical protein n=1 Tax=Klebsiella pneumoniae TaxID=573 RepID=UPI001C71C802